MIQQTCQRKRAHGTMLIRAERGFSLIEMMIVVVILAIMMGIAMPRYSDYISKARRNDARAALLEIAALQERLHFEVNQYSALITDLWSNKEGANHVSADGHYILTVSTANSGQEFTVSAAATGAQAGDTECATFTITQSGAKGASDGANDTSAICW